MLRKRSRLAGVIITQFVTSIPEGNSTPDFQCKPAPATVEEGGRHSSDHWFKFKNDFCHWTHAASRRNGRFPGQGQRWSETRCVVEENKRSHLREWNISDHLRRILRRTFTPGGWVHRKTTEGNTASAFWASSKLPRHVCRFTKSRQQKWTRTSVLRWTNTAELSAQQN